MAKPTQSLTQQLTHRAANPHPDRAPLLVFLLLQKDGTLPATITESERISNSVSETSASKMWEWMYNRAKVISSTIILTFRPLYWIGCEPPACFNLFYRNSPRRQGFWVISPVW